MSVCMWVSVYSTVCANTEVWEQVNGALFLLSPFVSLIYIFRVPNISYARSIRSVTLPFDFLYHSNLYRSVRLPSLSVLNITDLPTRRVVSRSSSSFNPISLQLFLLVSLTLSLSPTPLSLSWAYSHISPIIHYFILFYPFRIRWMISSMGWQFRFWLCSNVVLLSFVLVFYLGALFWFGTHIRHRHTHISWRGRKRPFRFTNGQFHAYYSSFMQPLISSLNGQEVYLTHGVLLLMMINQRQLLFCNWGLHVSY